MTVCRTNDERSLAAKSRPYNFGSSVFLNFPYRHAPDLPHVALDSPVGTRSPADAVPKIRSEDSRQKGRDAQKRRRSAGALFLGEGPRRLLGQPHDAGPHGDFVPHHPGSHHGRHHMLFRRTRQRHIAHAAGLRRVGRQTLRPSRRVPACPAAASHGKPATHPQAGKSH